MKTAPDWGQAERVLAVRLDSMGDVLMTGPALRAIKTSGPAGPGRHVTLLASPAGEAAAGLLADVDETIVYQAPWMKASPAVAGGEADRAMVEQLRSGSFDAAVIFTVYSQNPLPAALLCHLAGIPLRLAHCRENPYQLLTNWVPEPEPARPRHEVRRQLDLVSSVGCTADDERLIVVLPPQARQKIDAWLGLWRDERPLVVIHPGASAPSRRYPPEGFAEVARLLATDAGCRIVFTGSVEEAGLVESIRAAMGAASVSLAGQLDLAGLGALLSRADLLVSNNTGPVHLAAAVGTPVVDLYAQTNPQHTPWGVPNRVLFHDVACRWCYKSICPEGHHNCLRLVAPGDVYRAACDLLGIYPGRVSPPIGASTSPV